ncbi:MAG TPA: isovaleryl-CoA dehydrogenase [Casimicrobiaceae bacterium]|nr:isovaleryl-CoA dehydrogenase [Casimicrobiaceae bacterium]
MSPYPNQPPPYEDRNLFTTNVALREALVRESAQWAESALTAWGERMGRAEAFALARAANRHGPELRILDRTGERIDAVDFHPAWHELMRLATTAGEHASPWSEPRAGAQVARAAMYIVHGEVENGTQCPVTMTYASVPALRAHGADVSVIAQQWLPRILAFDYDPRPLPIAQKRAALIGMGMTERQGGSDVRSNRTRAERTSDGSYRLAGEKWFFSAPQCDAHLVLAQADAGLSCFLVPRELDDGTRNAIRLVRLKDKLGNRSNASSEVEFHGALAWRLGDEGRGIATILDMVQHTRLDCVIGAAGIMRGAFAWALHHASHRFAFGRLLVDQPLMRAVLADIALEVEAGIALAMRLARTFEADASPADRALARVLTPAAKYWLCKRGPMLAAEAMEVLGGNGYVEENPLPRMYREMPVNSIWEGSGNVIALDVMRALSRDGATRDALFLELDKAKGSDARFDSAITSLADALNTDSDDPAQARRFAQRIALTVQAGFLVRHAPAAIADGFIASRLNESVYGGAAFGALPSGVDTQTILRRANGT